MIQNYTLNDLVRLVYHETSQEETAELKNEVACDYELMEEYVTLKSASRELPKVTFAPSKKCLDAILAYSRETSMV